MRAMTHSHGTHREVDVPALRELVAGNLSAAARRIDPTNPLRVRRMLHRALKLGRISQGSADEIAEAYGVETESLLLPLDVPDPRVRELERLERQAEKLRAELGWPTSHSGSARES